MAVIPILVVAFIALLAWAAVGRNEPANDAAVEVARRRLAGGEINSAEFQSIRRHLATADASAAPSRVVVAGIATVVLFVVILATVIWAVSTTAGHAGFGWGWGMGNDGMGQMMGGGRNSASDPGTQGALSQAVVIAGFAYAPGNLQLPVGATVTWTNKDSAPHSASAADGSWDTGLLRQGQSASHAFDRAGTYEYYCSVHPNMKAKVVVR